MGEYRDRVFELGSESISDGWPFLQLGWIKEETDQGLKVVMQNKKGFNLKNPYVWVVHLHQKVVRPYVVKGWRYVNPDLGVSHQHSYSLYSVGGIGDTYTAQAITDNDTPFENHITRSKDSNYHQRAHFYIYYEDGSKDHWLVLFPQSFQDSDLADGHTHGGFQITFPKPVTQMIDVYTCIGCGAKDQGYTSLHSNYDGGGSDSLDRIHTGLPFDPWYKNFTQASLEGNKWMTPLGQRLGSKGDVWEFTGQYIVGKVNNPFTEASGNTRIPHITLLNNTLNNLATTRVAHTYTLIQDYTR